MIKSAAILAIAATGWRTVVSSGQIMLATGASSKPATDNSPGNCNPNFRAIDTTAAAMSSLLAKMAVGGAAARNILSAQIKPSPKMKLPVCTRSESTDICCARIHRRIRGSVAR